MSHTNHREAKEVKIPSSEVDDKKVVWYIVEVSDGFETWYVRKRYSQFEEMLSQLISRSGSVILPKGCSLPAKKVKLFKSHTSSAFIEERRTLLENFMKKMVTSNEVTRSQVFSEFVTSDEVEYASADGSNDEDYEPPEDVEVTDVSVPSTRNMSDHVLFQIDVVNIHKRKTFSKWTVLKRFGQFYDMDTQLRAEFADDQEFLDSLPAPPARKSKFIHDHKDPAFVEERRCLLENYLKKMIRVDKIVRNETFLLFLGVNV